MRERASNAAGALLAILSLIAGCKKDPAAEADKAIATHRPKATAHIEGLKKLASSMKAATPVTTDAVKLDAGPVSIGGADSFGVTAGLLYEEDLDDVESPHTKEKWPVPNAGLFGACGAMLKGAGFTALHKRAQLAKNCADAKYAVVVRTLERKAPVLDEAEHRFRPGVQAGEVHVWNLETGQELGGFRFSAENDDSVKSRGVSALHDVERDLAINVSTAIDDGFKKFAQ